MQPFDTNIPKPVMTTCMLVEIGDNYCVQSGNDEVVVLSERLSHFDFTNLPPVSMEAEEAFQQNSTVQI